MGMRKPGKWNASRQRQPDAGQVIGAVVDVQFDGGTCRRF